MSKADRLRPGSAGRLGEAGSELRGALAGQRRFKWVVGRPPDLRREIVAGLAQGFEGLRKQERLADRSHLRRKAELLSLGPKSGEIRRDNDAGHDLALRGLEGVDLRREIIGEILIAAWIGELVTQFFKHRREAYRLVAPGVAIPVIGKESAHALVGLDLLPHVGVDRDHVLQPPEEMEGVVERLPGFWVARVGLLTDEPGLPGSNGGDAGSFFRFARGRHRIGGLRRRRDQHQIDLVLDNEFLRDLGGPVRIGLAVLDDHLDVETLRLGGRLKPFQHEGVCFCECCERAGPRADIANLHSRTLGKGYDRQC